jgi:hypothetical protein
MITFYAVWNSHEHVKVEHFQNIDMDTMLHLGNDGESFFPFQIMRQITVLA